MVTKLACMARCRLNACICDDTNHNDMTDAILPQQKIKIGIREPTRSKMLFCDCVTLPWREVGVPFSTPVALGKQLSFGPQSLMGRRKLPGIELVFLCAAMRDDEHRPGGATKRFADASKVGNQVNFACHVGKLPPRLAPV